MKNLSIYLNQKSIKAILTSAFSGMLFVSGMALSVVDTGERIVASHTRTDIILLPNQGQLDELTDEALNRLANSLKSKQSVGQLFRNSDSPQRNGAQSARQQQIKFIRAQLIRVEQRNLNNPFDVNDPVNNAFVNGEVLQIAADDVRNSSQPPNPVDPTDPINPTDPPVDPPVDPPIDPPVNPQIPFGTGDLSECEGRTLGFGRSFELLIDPNTLNCTFNSGLGNIEGPLAWALNRRTDFSNNEKIPTLSTLTDFNGENFVFTQANRVNFDPFSTQTTHLYVVETKNTDVEFQISVTFTPNPALEADPQNGTLSMQVTIDSIVRTR